MSDAPRRIAVPARLSATDGADPRVVAANRIFADVVALVRDAGLEPVVVDTADLVGFDGVVLPGGGDVDPARYGGEQIDALYDVNPAQDDLDFDIAHAALAAGIPVLGICRGFQVLNAVYGGTLHEDLPPTDVVHSDVGDELTWSWHRVDLAPGSALADSHGAENVVIASGHHQGIATLGAGLVATAVAPDGLVEGFEDPAAGVIAVQWHPEAEGASDAVAHAPFTAFASRVRAAQKEGARV